MTGSCTRERLGVSEVWAQGCGGRVGEGLNVELEFGSKRGDGGKMIKGLQMELRKCVSGKDRN
jgi:hypothetical protein